MLTQIGNITQFNIFRSPYWVISYNVITTISSNFIDRCFSPFPISFHILLGKNCSLIVSDSCLEYSHHIAMLSRNVWVKLAMYVLSHFSLSIFSHSNKSFIFVPFDKCSFKDLTMPSRPAMLEYWQKARLDNGFLHRYSRTYCNVVRVENVFLFFISFSPVLMLKMEVNWTNPINM